MNAFLKVSPRVIEVAETIFISLPPPPPPPPPLVVVGKEQVEIAEQLRELLKAAAENPPQRSRSKQVSSLAKLTPGPPSEPPTPPTVTPSHKARNPALHTGSSPTPERRSPVPREAGKSKYYSEYFRFRVVVVRLHNVAFPTVCECMRIHTVMYN